MKVNASESKYQKASDVNAEFDASERRHGDFLLRRLRFLEAKVAASGGLESSGGSGAFAVWEVAALEWALSELGYIDKPG